MKPENAERELRSIIAEWAYEFSGDPGRSIADGEAMIAALKAPQPEERHITDTELVRQLRNDVIEDVAVSCYALDCAHKCGVGTEIAEHIRKLKRPEPQGERS